MSKIADIKFKVENTTDSTALYAKIQEIFSELTELGVEIRNASENGLEYVKFTRPVSDPDRREHKFIADRVSYRTLSDLVRFRDSTVFLQGLDKLRIRLGSIGWHAYPDCSRPHPHRIAVDAGGGSTMYFEETPAELSDLQDKVERQELIDDLYDHNSELSSAFNSIGIISNEVKFTIKENDPALLWSLTRENVDLLIGLARTINSAKKPKE